MRVMSCAWILALGLAGIMLTGGDDESAFDGDEA